MSILEGLRHRKVESLYFKSAKSKVQRREERRKLTPDELVWPALCWALICTVTGGEWLRVQAKQGPDHSPRGPLGAWSRLFFLGAPPCRASSDLLYLQGVAHASGATYLGVYPPNSSSGGQRFQAAQLEPFRMNSAPSCLPSHILHVLEAGLELLLPSGRWGKRHLTQAFGQ